ncbi:hypothetical protein BZB76_5608 [Actinomadura pelletieri DSM 43383]|uniref:PPE family protein n=1 Tax=Actinomadura pelletieri DSM 43383 TaxID=1120940 RepID=A0A495QGT1_9ACTN|nr:hypothetical protein [Actinomadura pelletieri]RKS71122.1 hypothetical protein BZB76_5608 [Actinomadura pelletieri DSM 43383]
MGNSQPIRKEVQFGDEGTGGLDKFMVWKDNFDKVREIVDSMQPGKMYTSSTAYGKLAARMDESVGLIYNQATRLVESWGGEDAEKAMTQMNKAYRQAQEIHARADTTSKALKTHGELQDGWQKQYGSGSKMDSWVKDAFNWGQRIMATNPVTGPAAVSSMIGNNFAADAVLDRIHDGTKQSNYNFPEDIRQDMPQANPNTGGADPLKNGTGSPQPPKMPGGGGPGGGPGGMPGGPGDLPGGPGGSGDLPSGPGGVPGGPKGPGGLPDGPGGPGLPGGPGSGSGLPGTDLAGLPPGGPGGGPGLGGGGLGGGPGGAPGLGSGGPGGIPGGAPGLGSGGIGAGPGAMGAGALGGSGFGARGGMTGMGMPMGAGARGGGDGNEHERSTWLTEDEDVWGGNDDTAPPVIG